MSLWHRILVRRCRNGRVAVVPLIFRQSVCGSRGMMTARRRPKHRVPIEIVARAIWLSFQFNFSLREVEEMMLERGAAVSYETIRRWCRSA